MRQLSLRVTRGQSQLRVQTSPPPRPRARGRCPALPGPQPVVSLARAVLRPVPPSCVAFSVSLSPNPAFKPLAVCAGGDARVLTPVC